MRASLTAMFKKLYGLRRCCCPALTAHYLEGIPKAVRQVIYLSTSCVLYHRFAMRPFKLQGSPRGLPSDLAVEIDAKYQFML